MNKKLNKNPSREIKISNYYVKDYLVNTRNS